MRQKPPVGIIVIIAIIIGGYFWMQDSLEVDSVNAPMQYELVSENQKNKNTNIEKDEIAGWQTYRNEEYGFEIKYSKNMPIKYNDEDKMLSIGEVAYEPAPGSMFVSIENKNISQYRDFIKENWRDVAPCTAEKTISLGDNDFQSVECLEAFAGGKIEMYFIEHNQKIYAASFIKSE